MITNKTLDNLEHFEGHLDMEVVKFTTQLFGKRCGTGGVWEELGEAFFTAQVRDFSEEYDLRRSEEEELNRNVRWYIEDHSIAVNRIPAIGTDEDMEEAVIGGGAA